MNIFNQYRGLRRENYILFFGRIVTNLGAMIWPMITLILNQKMGVDANNVAQLMVLAGCLMLPANYFGGWIADHHNKKMNIVYCDIVSVVCLLTCGMIRLSFISVALICIAGIFQIMEAPSYNALIADITPTANRKRAYSLQYLGGNIGLVLSPTIAGILFKNYLWLAFIISGTAIFCSTVLIFFKIKDITPIEETDDVTIYQRKREFESIGSVLKNNRVLVLYALIVGIYSAAYTMYNYLLPIDLGRIHGENGALIFGTITSINCITVVVFTPIITRAFEHMADTKKIFLCVFLSMIGLAIFWVFLGNIPVYYFAMIIFTWGEIFHAVADGPYTSARTPATHRGRITGLTTIVRGILEGIAILSAGRLYKYVGSHGAWIFSLVLCVLGILMIIRLIRKDKKKYPNLYKNEMSGNKPEQL